ncbi:MAG: DUF1566 domain-containing protein [Myxococcales bacterium]|nr:DUF1566 domain-containing protein [Myxococcales bacterium]
MNARCLRGMTAVAAACTLGGCSDPPAKAAPSTSAVTDASSDLSAGELVALDLAVVDGPVARGPCPGSPGCSCTSSDECSTGVCADDGQSASSKSCAFPFDSGCAAGFAAFTAQVGEGATVCVPAAPKLCNPCEKDSDCAATGGSGSLCVDHTKDGRFCGIACPAAGCPPGYACADVTSVGGAKAKQCQRSEQMDPLFQCPCSVAATALKLATGCQVINAAGTCGGLRTCGAGGLSACTGKTPAAESCNGQDDDCNGQTDDGPLCDDGNPCTQGDTCQSAACKPGVVKACSDNNDCTADACDSKTGNCAFLPTTATVSCDDGDLCTTGDVCASGACQAGLPKPCDGGACEVGSCTKSSGKCAFTTKPDTSPCDDGNPCTFADTCSAAVCTGQPKVCDDKDTCSVDSCWTDGTCIAVPAVDGVGCDDKQPCTQAESCKAGVCQGGTKKAPCQCATNSECLGYDDGLYCNGTLYCDKSAPLWTCKLNPATVLKCVAGDKPCWVTKCSEPSFQGTEAKCGPAPLPDGTTCSDGIALTVGDVCEMGVCKGFGIETCKSSADCGSYEDGDLCNGTLFCNKQLGLCQLNPKTVVYCPTADNTPCRSNLCAAKTGVCVLTPINELKPCEDGNLCTTGEACQKGQCVASAGGDTCLCKADVDCGKYEDGDVCNGTLFCNLAKTKCEVNPKTVVVCPTVYNGPCAVNTCSAASGQCALKATPGKVACNADSSECTPVDLCNDGTCVADTTNVCQCQFDTECNNDGNLCNGVSYCDKAANVCKTNPATVVKCATAGDTACSLTLCAAATGKCAKVAVTAACSDGDACTLGDVCAGGVCKAGPNTCGECKANADCDDKNQCTDDSCGGTPPACLHSNTTAACSDGDACTTADVCAGGKCGSEPLDCDDSEPCTTDTCKGGSCVYLAATSATCTDGDSCTSGDFCLNKVCKAGQGKTDCDDKLGCTVDSCEVFKGCVHKDDVALCDDKSACTVDTCSAGNCGNAFKVCDDNNPCTIDSCIDSLGCVVLPTTASCSDGNACTVSDKCSGGSCLPGAVTACDDGNACTADSCDPAKGCLATGLADGVTCSDGNGCTEGDKCAVGKCSAGAAKACPGGVKCNPSDGSCGCLAGTEAVDVTVTAGKKSVCTFLTPLWGLLADSRPATEFTVSADTLMVTDSKTGLVWQRSPPTTGGPSADGRYGQAGAIGYCDGLTLAGQDDWRLPTVVELASIVDYSKLDPAADKAVFEVPSGASSHYWTRTPYKLSSGSGWDLDFVSGGMYAGSLSSKQRLRCVRQGLVTTPVLRFMVKADASGEVVADALLQRTWQQATPATTYEWADAKSSCGGLTVQGGGWRLPTLRELLSLVDYQLAQPAIDKVAFPGTESSFYWSATAYSGSSAHAWSVDFSYGNGGFNHNGNAYRVRCVR